MTLGMVLCHRLTLVLSLALLGCGAAGPSDSGSDTDSGLTDAAVSDAGQSDAGQSDAGEPLPPNRALFVGNSYTFYNDLPTLYEVIVTALPAAPAPLFVDSSTAAGRRLSEHADDARTVGHALHTALDTDISWTHVVLQEQSQIPGFLDGNPEFDQSKLAAAALTSLADMRGATVVLFMTWGRRNGDSRNMTLYPDFSTMQDRLETGYRSFATEARAAGATVVIAPVGLAFREIHQSEVDPLASDALFYSLYASDGSHPSLAGSYLAACVLAATMLSVDASTVSYVPDGLDPAVATRLREAAQSAVTAERARP